MVGKDEELNFHMRKKAEKVLLNAYDELELQFKERTSEILKCNEELMKSNRYNRDLIEGIIDPLVTIDSNGKLKDVNKAVELLTGYSRDQLIGTNFSEYYTDPDKAKVIYEKVFKTGLIKDYELEIQHKNGNITPVLYNASIYKDEQGETIGVFAAARDITSLKKAEEKLKENLNNLEITVQKRTAELINANTQLEKTLNEKEILLKEIHHRVKNNLMIISSLLSLQSSYIKDKASQDVFKEIQNRTRSMALIHEKFYQSTDLKRINFGEYILSLTTELLHTYESEPSRINLKFNVEDILLDINTAIPLGLIVNEIITNSLEHAFPNGKKGEINVNFHPIDNHYEFTVKDNGIGFPKDLDFKNTDTLGLNIVNSLTDQINGEITLDRNNGTKFKITFKELEV